MKKDLGIIVSDEDLMLDACSFYGLHKLEFYKAFEWDASTKKIYENYIMQLVPYLKEIPLMDSNIDTFSTAIFSMNHAREKKYVTATIKSIQSVIADICYFAEVYSNGKYHNVLWGTTWRGDGGTIPKKVKGKSVDKINEKRLSTPKSLSLLEEIKILDIVRRDIVKNSYAAGMGIMFYMGLRPGECAGLKYGDIRPLMGHPEVKCLYVYSQIRTTKQATNELKTQNAYRVLPIPRELDMLLQKRMKFLQDHFGDVASFPIVCKREKDTDAITLPCNPNVFAEYCKNKLREVSVKETTLREAAEASKVEGRSEAAATSYLLRRNFATALLAVCGLEADEVKFLMGHAIYTLNESRRDYVNPDVLYRLWEKENIRSYFSKNIFEFCVDEQFLNIHRKSAVIRVPKEYFDAHPAGLMLEVSNVDTNDRINMIVQDGDRSAITMMSFNQPVTIKRADRVRIEAEFYEVVSKTRNRSEGHGKKH